MLNTTVILLKQREIPGSMVKEKRGMSRTSTRGTSPAEKKKTKKGKEEEEDVQLYPEEEQGILPDEKPEERRTKMIQGEEDEDPYTGEGRDLLEEDDEIQPWEEGFLEGAAGPGQLSKDALTGEPLKDVEEVIEAEIDGKSYRFTNKENARKFRAKKLKEKLKHQEE